MTQYQRGGIRKISDNLLRGILFWLADRLDSLESSSTGSGSGGSGAASSGALVIVFHANGPFKVATAVDGGFIVPSGFTKTIKNVWLHRTTAGSSSSTIVDLNKNGTTMYTTQANRPTIAFNDADSKVVATVPDITAITGGDIITMDIDQIEAGKPLDLTLMVEAS